MPGDTLSSRYSPSSTWQGYHVVFNGSLGRLELEVVESQFREISDPQISGGQIHGRAPMPNPGDATIKLHRLWQRPELIPVKMEHEAHGGGDRRMLSVLFGPLPGEQVDTGDASKQGANERDGALALAVGLLANESYKTGQFHHVKDLAFPGL